MNKKILFAALSIAALTACSTDEFESQNVAEGTSPVQFEVINNQFDDLTRASMDGNKIVWNANDGDLFTLYHGATLGNLNGYENATYTAQSGVAGSPATLTTPSMIKAGGAVMIWPVDSAFRITSSSNLSIAIPAKQTRTADDIPYVSDLVNIATYNGHVEDANTAGLNRAYPVYMRPMASQLTIKADYAGTDETIAELEAGDDGITPIKVESVDLFTSSTGGTLFTTEIPVKFTTPSTAITKQWNAAVKNNAWNQIVDFDLSGTLVQSNTLTATKECVTDNYSCKILLLPQADINTATSAAGVADGAVVVNTIYGSVVVAAKGVSVDHMTNAMASKYTATEIADAWYRYLPKDESKLLPGEKAQTYETKATTAGTDGLYKTTTNVMQGMMQTIDVFSAYTAKDGVVKGESVGTAANRNVKVLLTHLDMTNLHIDTDKQLRDAARVWEKLDLDDVTVYLDGNKTTGEFEMSQKTIETINAINAKTLKLKTPKSFKVMPCHVAGEVCTTIVITGGGDVQNIPFIAANTSTIIPEGLVNVAFNKDETWNWKGSVIVPTAGVDTIVNRGTMANAATATLKTLNSSAKNDQNNIPLINNGTWNITAGTLNVQFNVTNNGTVNISKGAQYRQDGAQTILTKTTFTNEATTLPERFFTAAQIKAGLKEQIGKVNNSGVFATVDDGEINNYGLIEHADVDTKTYVTRNMTTTAAGYAADAVFTSAFDATVGSENKIGRINLPYSARNAQNVSVSAALSQGFVSVTVKADDVTSTTLDASVVGSKVNYVIVNSGIKNIAKVSSQIKYVEIDDVDDSEIAWNVTSASYEGLMVLSPLNIKLGTTVSIYDLVTAGTGGACYLGADMYVGGVFNNGTTGNLPNWSGYYGDTSGNVAKKYITY